MSRPRSNPTVERLEDRRLMSTTTLISADVDGRPAGDHSASPSVSADGRYVAFSSEAHDLLRGDNPTTGRHVYVRDTHLGVTRIVSVDPTGVVFGNSNSSNPVITPDGRYVAFESSANNLVAQGDDDQFQTDVFLRDLHTGVTTLVGIGPDGFNPDLADQSRAPSVSDDGRFVAFLGRFESRSFLPSKAYVRDVVGGRTIPVAVDAAGVNHKATDVDVSHDGRFVAFTSSATTLRGEPETPFNTVGSPRAFLRDMQAGTNTLVSVDAQGKHFAAYDVDVSEGGRFVAFGTNPVTDVYVRDVSAGRTTLVSGQRDGTPSRNAHSPAISADGRFVAFAAQGDLTEHPVRSATVYLRDRGAANTTLISTRENGVSARGGSAPAVSADGRFVAYASDGNVYLVDTDGADTTPPSVRTPLLAHETYPTLVRDDAATYGFDLAYRDGGGSGIDRATLGDDDVTVRRPDGATVPARLLEVREEADAIVARYIIPPSTGPWFTSADNGTYAVSAVAGGVKDAVGNGIAGGAIDRATFEVNIRQAPRPPEPPTVPTAPGSAAALATSTSAVTLAWADLSDGEASFRIEVATESAAGPFTFAASAPANATRFSVAADRTGHTTYYYRVAAANEAGTSAFSNVVAVAPDPTEPPDPGVEIDAVDGTVAVSRGRVTLSLGIGNYSAARFNSLVRLRVFAALDADVSSPSTRLIGDVTAPLNLLSGAFRSLTSKLTLPAGMADGNYTIVAKLNGDGVTGGEFTAHGPIFAIDTPRARLEAGGIAVAKPARAGRPVTVALPLRNTGTAAASGVVTVSILSADGTQTLATAQAKVKVKAGVVRAVKAKLAPLGLGAGLHSLQVRIDPGGLPGTGVGGAPLTFALALSVA